MGQVLNNNHHGCEVLKKRVVKHLIDDGWVLMGFVWWWLALALHYSTLLLQYIITTVHYYYSTLLLQYNTTTGAVHYYSYCRRVHVLQSTRLDRVHTGINDSRLFLR